MERYKHIRDTLLSEVEGQLGNLECVDAAELGEVVDMVKDMEEAMYYHSVVKAMEEKEEDEASFKFWQYPHMMYYPEKTTKEKYMKAKEHEDKETAMHELEKYTEELADEVTDMLHWASAEEKTMLQSKMNALIAKIK
jgi:hypothetical protein